MKIHSLALLLVASFAGSASADDKLNIVATLPSLGYVARELAGDRAEVSVLARPQQDPHFVDPKPSFIVKVRDADLFVVNGLDLEIGWVPPLLEGARNSKIMPGNDGYFDASTAVTVIDLPKGQVDRSQGDVHPLGNPHYSLDPLALRAVAVSMAQRLSRIDAAGAAQYAARLKAFQKKIDVALFGAAAVGEVGGAKLAREAEHGSLEAFIAANGLADKMGGWFQKLHSARGQSVVCFHTNMNYFWRRFGVTLAGTVEPKPGIPPSAGHVADVVLMIRDKKIAVIVTQPYYDDSAVKLVAEKTGARVLKLDTEGDDQLAIIGHIADQIGAVVK